MSHVKMKHSAMRQNIAYADNKKDLPIINLKIYAVRVMCIHFSLLRSFHLKLFRPKL